MPVTSTRETAHVEVRTFGNFDVLVNGRSVSFARSLSKELFAYLVDRRGCPITRSEAFAVLWGQRAYDRGMQKQLDVVIRSMRKTLDEHGACGIVEMERGTLRVVPELLDCDLYRFVDGDPQAIASFPGEYLAPYPWARSMEGYLAQAKDDQREQ